MHLYQKVLDCLHLQVRINAIKNKRKVSMDFVNDLLAKINNPTLNEQRLMDCIRFLQQDIEDSRNQVRLELHTDIKDEICMTIRDEMWNDFRIDIKDDVIHTIYKQTVMHY